MATAEQEIKMLKKDLSNLKDAMRDKLAELTSDGGGYIPQIKEDFQELAQQAGKEARSLFNNTQKQFSDATHACEETIKEHPFRTSALIFMSGALLATLLRRK
ncbi:MAG: hypothetical protein K0R63_36 [Rickettsiales bacterium]|nr:hypothetical protein [Rickettsiales bacterium]